MVVEKGFFVPQMGLQSKPQRHYLSVWGLSAWPPSIRDLDKRTSELREGIQSGWNQYAREDWVAKRMESRSYNLEEFRNGLAIEASVWFKRLIDALPRYMAHDTTNCKQRYRDAVVALAKHHLAAYAALAALAALVENVAASFLVTLWFEAVVWYRDLEMELYCPL